MLWDSIPPAYPCLESYHWHSRRPTSKGYPCFASQVWIRSILIAMHSVNCILNSRGDANHCKISYSYSLFPWALDCGGGDVSPCLDPRETRLFPITSSVTFTDIPINTGPPKTRCFLSQQICPHLEGCYVSQINYFMYELPD